MNIVTVTVSADILHVDYDDDGNALSQYSDGCELEFDNEYDAYLCAHTLLSDGNSAQLLGYVNGGINYVEFVPPFKHIEFPSPR